MQTVQVGKQAMEMIRSGDGEDRDLENLMVLSIGSSRHLEQHRFVVVMVLRIPDSACTPKGHRPLRNINILIPNPWQIRRNLRQWNFFFNNTDPVRWLPKVYTADHWRWRQRICQWLENYDGLETFPFEIVDLHLLTILRIRTWTEQLALLKLGFFDFKLLLITWLSTLERAKQIHWRTICNHQRTWARVFEAQVARR